MEIAFWRTQFASSDVVYLMLCEYIYIHIHAYLCILNSILRDVVSYDAVSSYLVSFKL